MTTPGDLHTDVPLGTKVGCRKKKPEPIAKASPESAREYQRVQRGLANRAIVRAAKLAKTYGGCASCTFYTGAGTCFAYKQIPALYLNDGVAHTVPHAGTGGFTYRRVAESDVVTKALDAGIGPHLASWFGELARGGVAKSALLPTERVIVGFFYPNARPDGTLIVDTQGDVVTMDTLGKTIEGFMAGSRILGMDHVRTTNDAPVPVGEVLESHLLTKSARTRLGLPSTLELGWVGAARVDDEAAWQSVLRKERLSFSIGGKAHRIAIASGPD